MPPVASGIQTWSRETGTEPTLRVGIVLAEDRLDALRLGIGTTSRELCCDGHAALTCEPRQTIDIGRSEHGLTVRIGDQGPLATSRVRLVSRKPLTVEPGLGVLVHGVVAGRGFHWQKRVDQTLAGTIEVLPGDGGIVLVNELPLEDYLAGVITAEMSGACPADFLKAQCVVARSWLLAMSEPKHLADPFDRCNDDCCQRYQGTDDLSPAALGAVRETRGLALIAPDGSVLDANYAKSCGGVSETPRAVWGIEKPGVSSIVDAPEAAPERRFHPVTESNLAEYLDGEWLARTRVYCCPNTVPVGAIGRYLGRVDEVDDYFRWTVHYAATKLEDLLREKLPEAAALAVLHDLRVVARGVSGRATILDLDWADGDGRQVITRLDSEYRIRQVLHRGFLYSSAFAIRPERDADGSLKAVTLRGAGWGHGVGLCQCGAEQMARLGKDCVEILEHYYPKAVLLRAY